MFTLFTENFSNCKYRYFIRDLNNKQWVIQLFDSATNSIQGFSTLTIFPHKHLNRIITVVYAGDTIISKAFWGTNELSKSWIKSVLKLTTEKKNPVYWLLLSSGFRTYRFLPVFYREFFPRYDVQTPPDKQKLIDEIAGKLFGDEYFPELGIVRFKESATPLRKEFVNIDKNRLQNPHVTYFLKKNPGYVNGDELACLTRIDQENFTQAGKRMAR